MNKTKLFFAIGFCLISYHASATRNIVQIVLNAAHYFMTYPDENSVIQGGIQMILERQTKKSLWLTVYLPEFREAPLKYRVSRDHQQITAVWQLNF